jgi:hypothetical protein
MPNTVSVEAGETTVTGDLTTFVGGPGDLFNANGLSVPIAAVVSTSELTLAYGWPGAAVADSAAWSILTTAPGATLVAVNQKVTELLTRLKGGLPFSFDAGGTLASRALHDGAPAGFTYLRTDVVPMVVYAKNTDTAADWSAGTPMSIAGADVIAAAATVTAALAGADGPWTAASGATVSATSGTIASASAAYAFKRLGKSVFYRCKVTVTDNGTGSGQLVTFLPVDVAGEAQALSGVNLTNGKTVRVVVFNNQALMTLADGSYPADDGHEILITGLYEGI